MFNTSYGYAKTGEIFADMVVLARGEPEIIAELEKLLITRWRDRVGCRNLAPGGESAPTCYPSYCYLVYRFIGDNRSTSLPAVDGLLADC